MPSDRRYRDHCGTRPDDHAHILGRVARRWDDLGMLIHRVGVAVGEIVERVQAVLAHVVRQNQRCIREEVVVAGVVRVPVGADY